MLMMSACLIRSKSKSLWVLFAKTDQRPYYECIRWYSGAEPILISVVLTQPRRTPPCGRYVPFMWWTESREPFPAPVGTPSACSACPASSQGGSLSISWRCWRKRRRECCGRRPGASARSSSCSCTFRSPCLGCPRHLCCGCSPGRWPVSCPRGRWRQPRRAVCSGAPLFCFSLACRTPEWRWAWMQAWMRTPLFPWPQAARSGARACTSYLCGPRWSSSPGVAARVRRRWSNCRMWRYDRVVPPLHQALPASPVSVLGVRRSAFPCTLASSKRSWILYRRPPTTWSCISSACWAYTVGKDTGLGRTRGGEEMRGEEMRTRTSSRYLHNIIT